MYPINQNFWQLNTKHKTQNPQPVWVLAYQDASKWINVVLELLFLTFSSYLSFIFIVFIVFESTNEIAFMYYLILYNIFLVAFCSFLFNISSIAISMIKNHRKKRKNKKRQKDCKDEPTIRIFILHIILLLSIAVCIARLVFINIQHASGPSIFGGGREQWLYWMIAIINRSLILICVICILTHRSIHHKPRSLREYTAGNNADAIFLEESQIKQQIERKSKTHTIQESLRMEKRNTVRIRHFSWSDHINDNKTNVQAKEKEDLEMTKISSDKLKKLRHEY